jgi:hypothetical protein
MFKKNNNSIENALDVCLEKILTEGKSVEQCLADYPEYRDELKSLLDLSMQTHKAINSIEARPDFKAALRYRLTSSMNTSNAPKRSSFKFRLGWAPMALSLCIVMLLSGGGTVAAASNSMPSDSLYNVKLASEQVQLFFTFDAAGKAELYSEFVGKRVNEIVAMASASNVEAMEKSSFIMQNQLALMYSISPTDNLSAFVEQGAEAVAGVLTITSTETQWLAPEDTDTPNKHITKTESTSTREMGTITVTKTVTAAGADAYPVPESITQAQTSSDQFFVWNPPSYISNLSNQELVDTLYNNIMTLYNATLSNSGKVLESLLEAISILENSYNIAVGNIN